MTPDPSSPMANPGRQTVLDALTSERFSDPIWFRSVPAEVLDPQMHALRQLELSKQQTTKTRLRRCECHIST